MPILSPVTDNCPSWISGRERKVIEIFSWPNLNKRKFCRTWRLNPQPSPYQADGWGEHPIQLLCPAITKWCQKWDGSIGTAAVNVLWSIILCINDVECFLISFVAERTDLFSVVDAVISIWLIVRTCCCNYIRHKDRTVRTFLHIFWPSEQKNLVLSFHWCRYLLLHWSKKCRCSCIENRTAIVVIYFMVFFF